MSEKMSPDHPQITVILPVYRSSAVLAQLTAELTTILRQIVDRYEIIFVTDACPEGSAQTLQALSENYNSIKVVDLKENVGQHRAVLTGMTMAKGDYIAVMDADLQDPPSALPALLNKLREGYGAVFAGRRGRYESIGRLATSRIFKWLLHKVVNVPADAGMFFMISSSTAERLVQLNFTFPFVVAMIGCTGVNLVSIPIERSSRPSGSSSYSPVMRIKTATLALLAAANWRLFKKGRYRSAPYRAPIARIFYSAPPAGLPKNG